MVIHRSTILRILRALTSILVLKGAVAGSVSLLAVFGVTVPLLSQALGFDAPQATEGVAAAVGAVLGAVFAMKA